MEPPVKRVAVVGNLLSALRDAQAMPDAEELRIGIDAVEEAQKRIEEVAWRTPLVPASRHDDGRLHVKLECLQRTGSFKVRGAWNRMSRMDEGERARGFTAVSAGNHGQAVAWCAQRLEAPCTVWVPDDAVGRKVEAMQALGAKIERLPHDEIMASLVDDAFAREHPVFIHPFGDPDIMAGQGTIGLEILEDLPDAATVLVPVGGGGLVTGIATAIKARKPDVLVFGVQAERAAPYARSWESGRPERVGTPKTIADGIAASIAFEYMWPLLAERLDGFLTVSEDGMRHAIQHLAGETHVVAEAAGASAVAAAFQHGSELEPPVVAVVSGGNIDPSLLADLVG